MTPFPNVAEKAIQKYKANREMKAVGLKLNIFCLILQRQEDNIGRQICLYYMETEA